MRCILMRQLTSVMTSVFLTSPSGPSLLHLGWIPTMPKDIEVLLFLFWLGHAASFRVVSWTFDIPKSSVHVIVHRVSNAIIWIFMTVIDFPTGDDLVAVGEGFAQLAGSPSFSSAVGPIDSCHILLKHPETTAKCYLNRKLFHSIVSFLSQGPLLTPWSRMDYFYGIILLRKQYF